MKTKYTSKAGTIGRNIEKLVNSCKMNPMKFYEMERALELASGVPDARVTINGKSVFETPGYKTAQAEVDAILARIKASREAEATAATGLKPANT